MSDTFGSESEQVRFVPVIFPRDIDDADFYRSLLEDHGLEVRVDEDFPKGGVELDDSKDEERGIAVLVDFEHLGEAEAVIQERLIEEDSNDDGEGGDDEYEDNENEYEGLEEFDPSDEYE